MAGNELDAENLRPENLMCTVKLVEWMKLNAEVSRLRELANAVEEWLAWVGDPRIGDSNKPQGALIFAARTYFGPKGKVKSRTKDKRSPAEGNPGAEFFEAHGIPCATLTMVMPPTPAEATKGEARRRARVKRLKE